MTSIACIRLPSKVLAAEQRRASEAMRVTLNAAISAMTTMQVADSS